MNEIAISLKNVSKKYKLTHEKPTISEKILFPKKTKIFWALKNINLDIKKGENVAIFGDNGSGKTTLLKIISKITTPTFGIVNIYGKTVSLIELCAGFHPELTGEENIFLNALLIGMKKNEVNSKFKNIVKFSGVEKFIDSPLYTFSQGMILRLAFSIAIHANFDILIIDENFSVGDIDFKKKSLDKIKQFSKQGKTILIVSHNIDFLKSFSKRFVWLEKGKIKNDKKTIRLLNIYKTI